jgi:hypothetical protein
MSTKLNILVESISHLKELSNVDGFAEFYVRLNFGLRSSKRIRYFVDSDTFMVNHGIDDSWDCDINEKELSERTNIIEAIEKHALFYEGWD